jgi:hypothetical protein
MSQSNPAIAICTRGLQHVETAAVTLPTAMARAAKVLGKRLHLELA